MQSGGLGDDEDTAADSSDASFGTVHQLMPLVKLADLQTALAPPDEYDFGTKIYENVGLSDLTPVPVTRVCELLGLCSYDDDRSFIVLAETKFRTSSSCPS